MIHKTKIYKKIYIEMKKEKHREKKYAKFTSRGNTFIHKTANFKRRGSFGEHRRALSTSRTRAGQDCAGKKFDRFVKRGVPEKRCLCE